MKNILSRLTVLILLLLLPHSTLATDWTQEADCEGAWLYEASGDPYADSSAASNDGTGTGNPTHATASPPSGGFSTGYLVLDGNDAMALSPHIADYENLDVGAIVCYVNLDSNGTDDAFFGGATASDNNDVISFIWDDSNAEIDFLVKGSGSDVIDGQTNTSGLDWEDGSWHHFAYTTNNGGSPENKFYMDGVNVAAAYDGGAGSAATRAFFDDLATGAGNFDNMAFGRRWIAAGLTYLTGDIDECAIFSLSHDSTDINAIMDFGLDGSGAAVSALVHPVYVIIN